jgi:hypothetical protein
MAPQGLTLKHETAHLLRDWEQFGCPTAAGRDWTIQEIQAAIDRGPHKSALGPDTIKHFAEEVADKVARGQAQVILWDDIKHNHPRHLKVSPVAAIPTSPGRIDQFLTCLLPCALRAGESSSQSMTPLQN